MPSPTVVTSLKGITIGDTLSDVMFRHGDLDKLDRDEDGISNDGEVNYVSRKADVAFTIRNDIVTFVWTICDSEHYTATNGIACGDTGDHIIEQFPNKVRILCAKSTDKSSALKRSYDVIEYGTRYFLYENKVDGFAIADREKLQSLMGINWVPCGKH
jgi:hypothetical protein